jgi:hypothetical protein
MTTVTGCPAGTNSATTSLASFSPRACDSHRAQEKNRCARSWRHTPASPAPVSIPHTVRLPVWAKNPAAGTPNRRPRHPNRVPPQWGCKEAATLGP